MSAMETERQQQQPEAWLPTRVVIYMAKVLQNMMAFIWENHFEHIAFIWHPFFQLPKKEAHIEKCRGAEPNKANELVTGNEAMESSLDLLNGRRPLPLELNCEIFKSLPLPIQRKFICGLSRGIYRAFRQKLLVKTKRLRNPRENRWTRIKKTEIISADGLTVNLEWKYFFSKMAFKITGDCRKEYHDFPGTILYYFEVAQTSAEKSTFWISLANGEISADGQWNCNSRNYHFFGNGNDHCYPFGKKHTVEWPNEAIKNGEDDVVGCGLVLNPQNELSIFFTGNGILMGKQIQINPLADCLYPMVIMDGNANISFQTNFGDDLLAKPFKYDLEKCPGLGLD